MTTTTTATRKATKGERKATTKELTTAQQASLAKLVEATKQALNNESGHAVRASALAVELVGAVDARNDQKVFVARALLKLSAHPAVIATGGPTKGQPALTKMAALIGLADTSLTKYWAGARKLQSKGWGNRTGAPKAEERDVMAEPFKAESERVTVAQQKARTAKKGTAPRSPRTTTVSFESMSKALDQLVTDSAKYAETMGLTEGQLSELVAKLDAIHDSLEGALAK